jgi:hypothetical protein
MNGPAHYAKAEEFLADSEKMAHRPTADLYASIAQAHATLALVAITYDSAYEVDDSEHWAEQVK